MESPLFFSQLVLFALLWLFIILHLLQPKRPVTVPESPAAPEPMTPRKRNKKVAVSVVMISSPIRGTLEGARHHGLRVAYRC
jgi:hypothetical protein